MLLPEMLEKWLKEAMQIGIIGAGAMGKTLARLCTNVGHDVHVASSRGADKLAALPQAISASHADVVILAIPTKQVPELPRALWAAVRGDAIVIDLGNYHPELRDGRIEAIEQGLLDSQWASLQIERPVIKAFNNILAQSLGEKATARGAPGRVALPVAGDGFEAKSTVMRLVDDLGFDAVDGGTLAESFRQGTGAPAYCQDLDATALRSALARAQRSKVAEYRAAREAELRAGMAAPRF